jgi:energy-coupling factor transport system ATP-binding protein
MSVVSVEHLGFTYAQAHRPALRDIAFELAGGTVTAIVGPNGAGKSTLCYALAGFIPHFFRGDWRGRVVVSGADTAQTPLGELVTRIGLVFQNPFNQISGAKLTVAEEVAFGLENLGVPPAEIESRAADALAAVGAAHLAGRPVAELSGGELQRVCLASVLALRPRLLLLDEPTSQLDPEAAEALFTHTRALGVAVVVAEQRPALPLAHADRVVFLDRGRVAEALPSAWCADPEPPEPRAGGELVCEVDRVTFAYRGGAAVLRRTSLELRRGEVVALTGPNGSGKTTLAKLAAGLLEPASGVVRRRGRPAYLSQDPGRYLVRERVDEEVALGAAGNLARARPALGSVGLAGYEARHPRDLSSGERERLALACVLVTEPDLLVLDEPTRGVDPQRKAELAALLRRDAAGRATLVVTHDLAFATAVADRTVALAPKRELALA